MIWGNGDNKVKFIVSFYSISASLAESSLHSVIICLPYSQMVSDLTVVRINVADSSFIEISPLCCGTHESCERSCPFPPPTLSCSVSCMTFLFCFVCCSWCCWVFISAVINICWVGRTRTLPTATVVRPDTLIHCLQFLYQVCKEIG